MSPPSLLQRADAALQRRGGERDRGRGQHHHAGMAEREEESDADRALALLHQLARDVVDGGDMIGIDGMARAEAVGQQRGAEQDGITAKRGERPGPGEKIGRNEEEVEPGEPAGDAPVPLPQLRPHRSDHAAFRLPRRASPIGSAKPASQARAAERTRRGFNTETRRSRRKKSSVGRVAAQYPLLRDLRVSVVHPNDLLCALTARCANPTAPERGGSRATRADMPRLACRRCRACRR